MVDTERSVSDAEPLLLVQGLFMASHGMTPLRNFLQRTTNYDVFSLNPNTATRLFDPLLPLRRSERHSLVDVDLWFRQTPVVVGAVRKLADITGKPVTIVGHSHGGREGVIVASLCPEEVKRVVPVFSPLGDLVERPSVPVINVWSMGDKVIGPHTPLARVSLVFSPVNENLGEQVIVEGYGHLAPMMPVSGIHAVIAEQVGNLREGQELVVHRQRPRRRLIHSMGL